MTEEKDDNPFDVIIKDHRSRVGRLYDRFRGRIADIRKKKIEILGKQSAQADEERLAAIRKSIEGNDIR